MRSMFTLLVVSLTLIVTTAAPAAEPRTWIITNYQLQDGPFYEVEGGNYNDLRYHWSEGQGIQRAYWRFDFDDVPSRPALYLVEQWIPSILPAGVTDWAWLPIEVTFDGPGSGEEATNNENIPWAGDGTNHQWVGMDPPTAFNPEFPWQPVGTAHAPAGDTCGAANNGTFLWMRKGSTLYTKWLFGWSPGPHPITALRVTEVIPSEQQSTCDPATYGGPIDLGCIGNADPLYAQGELYGNGPEATVDGNSFGVEGFVKRTCFDLPEPLTPGVPASGTYTAHLPTGAADFKLHFDGWNTLKWRDDDQGAYARANIYTLNGTAGQEFAPGRYQRLYLLSAKGGGSNGTLLIEAVYSDDSVETTEVNLYDWFNTDGDDNALMVGVDGQPRRSSPDVLGFKRLDSNGLPDGGGDHGGAFFSAITVELNKGKTLTQIRLSIGDTANFGGDLCVMAASLEIGCNTPFADVASFGSSSFGPDGSVDQSDFAVLQRCYTGPGDPGGVYNSSLCGCLDVDQDADIDDWDMSVFEMCASGPAIPADPDCGL